MEYLNKRLHMICVLIYSVNDVHAYFQSQTNESILITRNHKNRLITSYTILERRGKPSRVGASGKHEVFITGLKVVQFEKLSLIGEISNLQYMHMFSKSRI